MKVIVLAAGEGKRMWPIQTDKYLIPFLGKPLLYHNLKQINANVKGEFVIIVTPRNKESIEQIAKELKIDYKIAIQREPKGMADAILSAKDLIDGEVLVVNAEDVLDEKVYEGILPARNASHSDAGGGVQGADVVVAGLKLDKYFPGGYLEITGDRVQGIVEKPGEGSKPSDLIKLVVDYFKDGKKLLEYLQKAQTAKDDQYEMALDQMIKDGAKVNLFQYEGIWIPLKYPWYILDIMDYLLSKLERRISPNAKISDKAIVEGNVIVEDGVKIFEGAVIKGPCYIGKDCIVGNNSMVRESGLEEGCVTGFNSDITRSYIGTNSWFHTNYIGDSVLEGDFGMGSGAVLANLRLDNRTILVGEDHLDTDRHKLGLIAGRGVRVGVNASTMPGARIGSNSLVGPGVVLYGDVAENKKVLVKQPLEITEHTPVLTSYDQFRDKLK